MSRIDELIAELAPRGVDYVETTRLFELRNGYTPPKSNVSFWSGGTIPWFRMEDIRANGGVLDDALQRIPEAAVKGGRLFPPNSLLVATSATIGEHALVTVPHLSNQRFTSLSMRAEYAELVDMKFMYYYGFVLDEWCRNNTTTSSFASVDMSGFRRFKFPVPPLEVQREIVRILDQFTQLEAELEAELDVRRVQHAHYRDQVLLSSGAKDRVVRLGDVSEIAIGFPFKSSQFSSDETDAALVRGDNIGQGRLKSREFKRWKRTASDGLSNYELRGGDIVLAMDRPWIPAGLKWAAMPEHLLPALLVQRVARLRAQDDTLDQTFLAIVISSAAFTNHVLNVQTGNTVPHISGGQIGSFEFPLPTLAEQRRIASAIQNFDALVNDLSVGLPAELAARRKQYEYYRDKLLTFEEAVA